MRPDRIAGFTLVEAMTVISIICAVIVSIPPLLQRARQQGVRHAVIQLQADLQLARITAIRQKQTCTVIFNRPALNQYIFSNGNHYNDLTTYHGAVHFLKQGPDGVRMAQKVDFNRQGMSTSVIPADIFLGGGQGMATYRIRVLLPGGISVYRWRGDHWQ